MNTPRKNRRTASARLISVVLIFLFLFPGISLGEDDFLVT
jgi:hypothetical protein